MHHRAAMYHGPAANHAAKVLYRHTAKCLNCIAGRPCLTRAKLASKINRVES